jgi:cytochrome c-type biogenesis protein CcmH
VTFWTILIVLCLLAILFAVGPLWQKSHRLTPLVASVIVFTVALSAGLYDHIGSPALSAGASGPSGQSGGSDELMGMDEAIGALEARLANDPEDIEGWKMLARTQMTMRNYAGATTALEKAVELENGQVAQTLVDLALAILSRDNTPIEGRPKSLIDNALALEPTNQAALFYSGVAAANSGDTDTAATHFETLLGLNPPEEIRAILEDRIALWRGEMPPAMNMANHPEDPAEATASDAIISAQVSMSAEVTAAMTGDANIFLIARDPNAPSPPIAVSRLRVSELPAVVDLTDAQSMVAGRELSGFAEVEVLARISLSGGPAAASGDWFGSKIMRPADSNVVSITINQQVP